ncbi:MAG: DUF3231 family protein [Firmicutes bacterium]|nr:DUF3231 family protein [Bacillota bacterium]
MESGYDQLDKGSVNETEICSASRGVGSTEEFHAGHPGLNSSEIANLWNSYMYFDMISGFLKYLFQHVEDEEIKSLVGEAASLYEQRVKDNGRIMEQGGLPVPAGFTAEDIKLDAPRLYSDLFCIYYLFCLERFVIPRNSFNLGLSTRKDVRAFYEHSVTTGMRLFERVADVLLAKGLYIRFPYVTVAKGVDFVKKQDFLTGFLGERRPALAQEVASSFHVVFLNSVGKHLLTGFRQTARSEQVRDYIDRGKRLAEKIIDIFSSNLKAEDIPVPMFWDSMVTDSTEPPVSDKLMLFHIALMNTCGAMEYSLLMALNFRHDLKVKYLQIMAEAGDFAEDCTNILIDKGWFEEPPRVVDRRELVNESAH